MTSRAPSSASRRDALTTPAILRAARAALVVGTVVVGVTTLVVLERHRRDAADIAGPRADLVVAAQDLYVALVDADAAATSTYLQAGYETTELRERYEDDMTAAGATLASLAGRTDLPASSRAAITTLAEQIPIYTGLVETARVNNRLDFPLGAAYLDDSSDLMRDTILPAATEIYDDASRDLDASYRAGEDRTWLVVLGAIVVVLVGGLVATQLFLTRRMRRWVNPAMLAATLLVLAAAGLTGALFEYQRDALAHSRDRGADPLLVASTTRILTLRSLSAENLDLLAHGTVPEHRTQFATLVEHLGDSSGTTGSIGRVASSSDGGDGIRASYRTYLAAREEVVALMDDDYSAAVDVALSKMATAATDVVDDVEQEVARTSDRLEDGAVDARVGLAALVPSVAVATALVAAFVALGLRPRIREYR